MSEDNFNGNADNGQQFGQGQYDQQQYNQQPYNQQQFGGAGDNDKIMAIISLVTGILSIVLVCFTSGFWEILGLLCGVAAIVLSVLSKKKIGKNGMATAGMICGIVALALYVVIIILAVVIGVAGLAAFSSLM